MSFLMEQQWLTIYEIKTRHHPNIKSKLKQYSSIQNSNYTSPWIYYWRYITKIWVQIKLYKYLNKCHKLYNHKNVHVSYYKHIMQRVQCEELHCAKSPFNKAMGNSYNNLLYIVSNNQHFTYKYIRSSCWSINLIVSVGQNHSQVLNIPYNIKDNLHQSHHPNLKTTKWMSIINSTKLNPSFLGKNMLM